MTLPFSPYSSLGARFLAQCDTAPHAVAFRAAKEDGTWKTLTWAQTADEARNLAAGLLALGIRIEDRVAIASSTRLEWILADLAVALAGAATSTVYPTTNVEDVTYIVTDCAATIVFAENLEQLDKLRTDTGFVGSIHRIVLFDGDSTDDAVLSLDELAALGCAHLSRNADAIEHVLDNLTPENLATIIYTSGTTGRPKGVELTHGNWLYLGAAVATEEVARPDHVNFLWLPLAHVFGKLLLAAQYEIGFMTVIDGRIDRIIDNLAIVRPTFMAAAPRIFEKIYSRVATTATASGGLRTAVYTWAFNVGVEAVRRRQQGRRISLWHTVQLALANRLVFSRIRDLFGGRLQYLVSGSAALSPQIAEWFTAAGLPIMEGYGLTETTGAAFANRPGANRIGSVGLSFPDSEVKIADDGEILLRGPGLMRGYHGLPEETAAVIDSEGWFSTGDIGELDSDGFLTITDRKKDLIKTSGGKYIAPTPIESAVKAACPIVSQAVVIADGRNFASILLALDPDATATLTESDVNDTIHSALATVNATLNRWETIKQYRLLPTELSIEAGELTPSLKVKRAVVARKYTDLIDTIYPEVSQ